MHPQFPNQRKQQHTCAAALQTHNEGRINPNRCSLHTTCINVNCPRKFRIFQNAHLGKSNLQASRLPIGSQTHPRQSITPARKHSSVRACNLSADQRPSLGCEARTDAPAPQFIYRVAVRRTRERQMRGYPRARIEFSPMPRLNGRSAR